MDGMASDEPVGSISGRIVLRLEIETLGEPISGLLQAAEGPPREFVGWLELTQAIERLRAGGGAHPG